MLIPDICCFIYSIYFVLFKQVDYPKFMQFLCIFIVETLYAIGRGVFVFFVAPYFSKSLNISVGWFITLAPILMNLTSKKESIKMFSRLCPNKLGQIIMRFKKFLVLCVWGLGIAMFCFTPTVWFQNIWLVLPEAFWLLTYAVASVTAYATVWIHLSQCISIEWKWRRCCFKCAHFIWIYCSDNCHVFCQQYKLCHGVCHWKTSGLGGHGPWDGRKVQVVGFEWLTTGDFSCDPFSTKI